MITTRDLATVQAALRYWQEEMCPHGGEAMQPYWEMDDDAPLAADNVARLRETLRRPVRYAVYDPAQDRLAGDKLFENYDQAQQSAGKLAVATVFVPQSHAA